MKKRTMPIVCRGIILAFLVILLLPGTKAMAASKKKKAMKAYAKYLAKQIPVNVSDSQYYNASFAPSNTNYVNCFFLHDINKDKVPELFTQTNVNLHWFNMKIFTYKSGKVKPYKIKGKGNAVFVDRATANGGFDFYICKKTL